MIRDCKDARAETAREKSGKIRPGGTSVARELGAYLARVSAALVSQPKICRCGQHFFEGHVRGRAHEMAEELDRERAIGIH
jgi:hypothetical protein